MPDRTLSSGVTLHVEEAGRGPALVLVHGWSMSGSFFHNQLAHFSASHRVIIPDMRGHGKSEKVLDGHTVANYARDLKMLLDDMGVEQPVLLGWSMGAMIVYDYLKQFSQDDTAGIIVVDQPPSDFAWEGYPFGLITVETLAEFVEALQLDAPAVAAEFAELMQHAPVKERSEWMIREITRVPPAVAATILVNQTIRDDRAFLPAVRVPTLVLFGADDKMTSPEAGKYIADHISTARLHIFANSSHVPFLEEPEEFNRVVEDFLAEITARA